MHTKAITILAGLATMGAAAGSAAAQTRATCTFDAASATLIVNMNGRSAVLVAKPSGELLLDNEACGTATRTTTDTIQVVGGDFNDSVGLSGNFTPGLTAEPTGDSEIEIAFALGAGSDTVVRALSQASDRLIMTSGGIDTGDDGDEDITTAGTEFLAIECLDGDDLVNAAAYTGTPAGGRLSIAGSAGNDRLTGDSAYNLMFGGYGDDVLFGGGGDDILFGNDGNDTLDGGPGDDHFDDGSGLPNGGDVIRGGTGVDTVDYRFRLVGITVTVGNGLADDGEPGEGDQVEVDVENLIGGKGDDVLVGSDRRNRIEGRLGNDEIYGGARNDTLEGGGGNDVIFGDDGNDRLDGAGGDDTLTGGAGSDTIDGYTGDDIIFNADGIADTVVCGDGSDDAEDDPLDTFDGCEL